MNTNEHEFPGGREFCEVNSCQFVKFASTFLFVHAIRNAMLKNLRKALAFSERGSVSRSGLAEIVTCLRPAMGRDAWLSNALRVTDPRSFGCGPVAPGPARVNQ
jgi:hypothetical protein